MRAPRDGALALAGARASGRGVSRRVKGGVTRTCSEAAAGASSDLFWKSQFGRRDMGRQAWMGPAGKGVSRVGVCIDWCSGQQAYALGGGRERPRRGTALPGGGYRVRAARAWETGWHY